MSLSDRLKFLARIPNGPAAGLDDIDRLVRRSLLVCLPISVRRFLAHRNRRLIIEPEESTARLFLMANGVEIAFDKIEAINTVLALAAGELSEDELADWFRQQVVAAL